MLLLHHNLLNNVTRQYWLLIILTLDPTSQVSFHLSSIFIRRCVYSLCFSVTRSDSGTGGGYIPSAEQVALSLLSQFNEYHLPKADQLVWLVSEKEAPQAVSYIFL